MLSCILFKNKYLDNCTTKCFFFIERTALNKRQKQHVARKCYKRRGGYKTKKIFNTYLIIK